jgi:hypothetical protein
MKASPQVLVLLKTSRRILGAGLLIVALGFLALFGLQYSHPPKWDSFWLVVQLHQVGDPVLNQRQRATTRLRSSSLPWR